MHRIGIVGCAGTGKTSLAEVLAVKLGVPLLKSREITEDILKRDGYSYASGIQIERFLANSGRQNEILRRTLEQQSVAKAGFVTDRTVVDLAAYVVCEMHDKDEMAVRRILETCRKRLSDYSHLFMCPWKDVPVSDNKRRTLNPWYQFLIHTVEIGMLREWDCHCHVLAGQDTESRVKEIAAILGRL